MMAESVNDVATVQRNLQRDLAAAEDDLVAQGRQARDLQRDLLRTRMVEFDSLPSVCTPWCARPPRRWASRCA